MASNKIEWAIWGNEQTIISCFVLCIGSILGVCSIMLEFPHIRWPISIYGLVVSLLVLLLEYPRGTVEKRKTIPRRFQEIPSKIVQSLRVFGRNYFVL